MGAIEDTRKVLQDFLAPELRSITSRLDALEKKVDDNDRCADRRHDEVMMAIRQVIDWNSIQQGLAKLGSKELSHQ